MQDRHTANVTAFGEEQAKSVESNGAYVTKTRPPIQDRQTTLADLDEGHSPGVRST